MGHSSNSSPGPETPPQWLWQTNGFRIKPLAATDIVQQFLTNGIEAVPTTALYALTAKFYETTGYMCDVKWAPLIGATIVSKETWEKIPADCRCTEPCRRRPGNSVSSGP